MKSLLHWFSRKEATLPDIFPVQIQYTPESRWIPPEIRLPNPSPEIFPKQCPCPTTIKHIVLSGGGEMGFSFYSALRESNKAGFWNIRDIESVYGTSVGSIFAVLVSLLSQFDWDTYDDFITKRPWHHVFDFNLNTLVYSIQQKGIFGIKAVEEIFAPLFNALDIPIDITMSDFHKITGIDLHIITAEVSCFELIDISHTTFPEWKVIEAIYCSACLPILFIPHSIDDKLYIDGGTLSNYPIKQCINNGCDPDEVLGFYRIYTGDDYPLKIDTMFDYLFYIIGRLHTKVVISQVNIKNQIGIHSENRYVSIYNVYRACADYAFRNQLVEKGVDAWRTFYAKTYPDKMSEP